MSLQIPIIQEEINPRERTTGTVILCGTDVHGQTCGINAYYVLKQYEPVQPVKVYSHFAGRNDPRPTTLPMGIGDALLKFVGARKIYVFDIPVAKPKADYILSAYRTLVSSGTKVIYADHHGMDEFTPELYKMGVDIVVVGGAYDLSMYIPRVCNVNDSFVQKWSIVGAVADFDTYVLDKITREVELYVCEYLDQAMKLYRPKIAEMLHLPTMPDWGEAGSLIYGIVEKRVEPEQVIEVAMKLVKPLEVPPYNVVEDVVYVVEKPKQFGLVWKLAWKLCYITETKVAVIPVFDQQKNVERIVIAKNWYYPEVISIIEEYARRRFAGHEIVGHPGAVSIAVPQATPELVKQVAMELAEEIKNKLYYSKTVDMINVREVAKGLKRDVRVLVNYAHTLNARQERTERLLKAIAEKLGITVA